jgi:hypothetical protein
MYLSFYFTFGFLLPFSFLIDGLSEGICSSVDAAGLWLLCVLWGGEALGLGVA